MQEHFTFFSLLGLNGSEQKFAAALVLGAVLVTAGRAASRRISSRALSGDVLIPEKSLSLFSFFDFLIDSFVSYQDTIMGRDGRKYLPITGGLFLFILSANLLGLIPGMPSPTTTVWVTVALALVSFVTFNFYGIKEHGIVGYLKHFMGPLWWLAWLVFPLEIMSTILRVLTLNLRLYWNITADHVVLGIFTDMTKVIVPVAFYLLGSFVCFMQAFVFATLTMVYIRLATEHGESQEQGGEHAKGH